MKRVYRYSAKILFYLILAISLICILIPIILTITNSFMSPFEVFRRYTQDYIPENSFGAIRDITDIHYVEVTFIPDFVTLKQYFNLLFKNPLYMNLFWNSVKIAIPSVVGQIIIAAPAAYAFEYSKMKYKELIFLAYIVIMLMPMQVLLVPNYFVASFLSIENSYLAIILPAIFSPFGVFLIRQYLKGLPYEYIEAAKIDGASQIKIIFYVVSPLIKPAVSALCILLFIEYWNLVDQAVVFIDKSYNEPLSVYLSKLINQDFELVFAASCFYMILILLIFLYGQKYLVEGIQQQSGLK